MKKTLEKFVVSLSQKLNFREQGMIKGGDGVPSGTSGAVVVPPPPPPPRPHWI